MGAAEDDVGGSDDCEFELFRVNDDNDRLSFPVSAFNNDGGNNDNRYA